MSTPIRRSLIALFALHALVVAAAPVRAQSLPCEGQEGALLTVVSSETFTKVWQRVSSDLPAELGRASSPDDRKAAYRRVLNAFVNDQEFTALRSTERYRQGIQCLVRELPDTALAQSSNAPITTPASNSLLERSGSTQLLALAGDFRKVFSADESAVSVNLNAIALLGGGKPDESSAQLFYSNHEAWRRLSGTITFGGKVPDKDITGLSGLPGADELFDAFSWDVKVRLVGDRDPLASHWYPLLVGSMGQRVELLTRLLGLPIDPADTAIFRDAADEVLGTGLRQARDRIASSLQISVKAAGAHLTEVAGKNKYSFAIMLDKGFSGLDLTVNTSYNVADVTTEEATDPFSSKDLQLAAGLSGSVLKNRLADGRDVELSASLQARVFVDDDAVPVDRKNTFKLNATLTFPFQLKGKIPVSVTWTNDPNNLAKDKYVSGQIGVSYDFAAVWDVLKGR